MDTKKEIRQALIEGIEKLLIEAGAQYLGIVEAGFFNCDVCSGQLFIAKYRKDYQVEIILFCDGCNRFTTIVI